MENYTKPLFAKNPGDDLFQRLRQKVNETVRRLEPVKKHEILLKAILFPSLYIFAFIAALVWGQNKTIFYCCYFFMGVLLVLNFLNIIHEAVHHTLFKDKKLNNLYIHFFDLLGANSYIWKLRHIRLHHNYPNIIGWDSDFEQSTLMRSYPHGVYSKYHKYQHIYLPFIYPYYLFNWLLVRDFTDFFKKNKIVSKVVSIPRIEYVKLFIFKATFFFYTIVLPVLILHINWFEAISAFFLMVLTASIISLLVLLTPHANIESKFPLPAENGNMPTGWFVHQLATTNDISEDNRFTRFFMGCFNYHIAHHLFPSINHIYYPEITKIIEQFAKENKLPYRKFPLLESLHKHYLLLKNNAVPENIFEETM